MGCEQTNASSACNVRRRPSFNDAMPKGGKGLFNFAHSTTPIAICFACRRVSEGRFLNVSYPTHKGVCFGEVVCNIAHLAVLQEAANSKYRHLRFRRSTERTRRFGVSDRVKTGLPRRRRNRQLASSSFRLRQLATPSFPRYRGSHQ